MTKCEVMKKSVDYQGEDKEISEVNEPEVSYVASVSDETTDEIPFMSIKDLGDCLSLEESRRLIFERIHHDFHK